MQEARRDRLGRRIGRNWWREYIMSAYLSAWHHRDELAEANHQMEPDEFDRAYPKPRLKDFLVANAGIRSAA